MKKSKLFFMTLFIAIILFGASNTSLAFDLSSITEKPAEFFKYIAHKLGFGDSDDEKLQGTEPSKEPTVNQLTQVIPYNPENDIDLFYPEFYRADYSMPFFYDGFTGSYGWYDYNEKINFNYVNKDRYFKIGTGTGQILSPFTYNLSNVRVWQTRVEYLNNLPSKFLSQFNAELFLESTFFRQPAVENYGGYSDSVSNYNPGNMGYGFRINAVLENAKIGLFGWYGNHATPLNIFSMSGVHDTASNFLWQALNAGYYQGRDNVAATISYQLPFMSFFHQGVSPTISLETAYRFGTNDYDSDNLIEGYDQWKVGMSYQGRNHIDWLNPYGINWGIGYSYTVAIDDLDNTDYLQHRYSSYSGNINANTYWFNMKLNTMFMYLYDRRSRSSMTVLNATYSPDWRWSYGIKANFYYGKKDGDSKELKNIPELVTTFTATYRWD